MGREQEAGKANSIDDSHNDEWKAAVIGNGSSEGNGGGQLVGGTEHGQGRMVYSIIVAFLYIY